MAGYWFDVVRTLEAFYALAGEWRALDDGSQQKNPFVSFAWVAACFRSAVGRAEPFVLAAREDGKLAGVAPFELERRFGFRVLRFAGGRWSEYVDVHRAQGAAGVEQAMFNELQRRRGEWDLLELHPITDEHAQTISANLPGDLRAHSRGGEGAPYLAFDGDWETLRKSGPYWLREMPKSLRRFERDGGSIVCLRGADAAAAMDDVARVEASSWKADSGRPEFQGGVGPALLRDAFTEMPEVLELWLARMNGIAVAYQIAFRMPKRIGLYSSSFDAAHRRYSPGLLTMYAAIQEAWREGAREYDFMNGNTAYKIERANAVRPLQAFVVHPTTLTGRLAHALLVAPRWALSETKLLRPLSQGARAVRDWVGRLRPTRAPAPTS